MQIAMHSVGDIGTVDRIFMPYEDTGFRNYLRDRYERTTEYLDKMTTTAGRAFLDRSKKIYDAINSSEALRAVRSAVRSANALSDSSNLFNISDIDGLRSANYETQRILMADPVIRRRYLDQLCDGFSETYRNREGADIGEDDYVYRRVTNGVFMPSVGDGEEVLTNTRHYEMLYDNDREMDVEEQFTSLDLWDLQRQIFEAGLDSTNRLGGTLA